MMIDPVTLRQLSDIKVKEQLEQAEKRRLFNKIAGSNRSVIEFIVTTVSGWMQRPTPVPTSAEPKHRTAEIPSL